MLNAVASRRRWSAGLLSVPLLAQSCAPQCAPAPPPAAHVVEQREIGSSFEGRPIVAFRLGTPGGTPVLAVGSIHGDEQAGIEIVEHVRDAAAVPAGLDVWIVPTINPDGNARDVRTNARGVDTNWAPVDCAVLPRNCAGFEPLGEPESRVRRVNSTAPGGSDRTIVTTIQPRLMVMFHDADHLRVAAASAHDEQGDEDRHRGDHRHGDPDESRATRLAVLVAPQLERPRVRAGRRRAPAGVLAAVAGRPTTSIGRLGGDPAQLDDELVVADDRDVVVVGVAAVDVHGAPRAR